MRLYYVQNVPGVMLTDDDKQQLAKDQLAMRGSDKAAPTGATKPPSTGAAEPVSAPSSRPAGVGADWVLMVDGQKNKAWVSPDKSKHVEVR